MTKQQYEKAIELMAEYIVTLGGVDYHLCDEIPREIHLKHQPKDDGNYDNEPCQRCVISLLQNDSFVDDGGTTVDENEE